MKKTTNLYLHEAAIKLTKELYM